MLDPTFGPTLKFASVDHHLLQGSPPVLGLQFYGVVDIPLDGKSMKVTLKNRAGKSVYSVDLTAT
jgi:alkaline phosphatase D